MRDDKKYDFFSLTPHFCSITIVLCLCKGVECIASEYEYKCFVFSNVREIGEEK